jgi:branched-chain amino acid transport system substrate-binding protein
LFHIAIGSAALNRTAPGSTVRFTLDAGAEQKQINQYLRSFERIAVLAMDNDLGNTWLKMLRQSFPGKIVSGSLYNPQEMDISTNLVEIKDKNPV